MQSLTQICEAAGEGGERRKGALHKHKTRERTARASLKADAQYQRDRETARILERRCVATAEIERIRREYRIALIDY